MWDALRNNYALIGLGGEYVLRLVIIGVKKSTLCVEVIAPVPETDTGGEVENTKGREITLSKELGKITP